MVMNQLNMEINLNIFSQGTIVRNEIRIGHCGWITFTSEKG